MIKNKIIKKLLLDGSTQISAVLPRQSITDVENTFSLYFPILLNSETYNIEKEIDKFQIVFYNQQSFSQDFDRKFNSLTEDFKTFSESQSTNYFSGVQQKLNNNFYFDSNISSRSYSINFSLSNIDVINEQKIYRLAFTNNQSKEIKNESFNCCRIFCIKDKSVVDDTDIVMFSSSNFINEVFTSRIVYDLNYFLDSFYFNNFSNNLGLEVSSQSSSSNIQSVEEVNRFIAVVDQEIDPNIGSGSIDFMIEYISGFDSLSVVKNIDLASLSRSNIIEDTSNIFEKVCIDFVSGRRSFVFNISCTINFTNSSISKFFTKNLVLSHNSLLINNIFSLRKKKTFSSILEELNFKVTQNIDDLFFKIIMSSRGTSFDPNILSSFFISDIQINNRTVSESLYLDESMGLNSKVDLVGLSLLEAFDIQKRAIEVYARRTQALNVLTSISIRSSIDETFVKKYESDVSNNKINYKNLYNNANEIFKRIIEVEDNEPTLDNISENSSIQSYANIKILDVKKLKNLAYQLGYYEENLNQNSEVVANIIDFLSSCVFMIEVEESFSTYKTNIYKTKNYYYGEEILNLENFNTASNIVYFNQEFISKINNSFNLITKSANEKNKVFRDIKRVITKNVDSSSLKPIDIKSFLKQKTLQSTKEIKILIIPVPKIIKVFQGTGVDRNGNLIFKEEVTASIKSEVSLRFVNMFYDSNSSLNWDFYNKIKNTFFFNKDNSSESLQLLVEKRLLKEVNLSLADTIYPMWDYLSSNLYIDKKNMFFKNKTIKKEDFFEKFKRSNSQKEEIFANFHFENFGKKYFNFRENSKDIFLDTLNMTIEYSDFERGDPSYPKKVSFKRPGTDKVTIFSFDITHLKNISDINSILDSEIYLKYSIHPLVEKSSNDNITFNTPYYTTSIESGKSFITQNHVYMSERSEDFISYNMPLNKSTMDFVNTEDSLFLKVYVDQDLNKITTRTFKDYFEFCLNNDCNFLLGFYLRFGLSFKIREEYFYTNIINQIPIKNLNNNVIFIDRINTIVS